MAQTETERLRAAALEDVQGFALEELLGRGSYGSVFKGRQASTGECFAVKSLALGEGDEGWETLRHEVALLQECTHGNIVCYLAALLGRSYLWLIMEYCGGGARRCARCCAHPLTPPARRLHPGRAERTRLRAE